MADEPIHDLTAAYALDALDPHDEERYEEHLATCERCREELAELRDPVAMLAYGIESPTPPPELRTRILDAARAERSNVVPIRRRWPAALGRMWPSRGDPGDQDDRTEQLRQRRHARGG